MSPDAKCHACLVRSTEVVCMPFNLKLLDSNPGSNHDVQHMEKQALNTKEG